MDNASETIYALRPVSFRYHEEYDASQTIAFGLIAEEVAEANPDLVGRNPKGQPESVRYEQINAMLLNEFLKEHRRLQELQASDANQKKEIAELKSTIAEQQKVTGILAAQLKEQAAQVRKVSAHFQMSKPAPQMVQND